MRALVVKGAGIAAAAVLALAGCGGESETPKAGGSTPPAGSSPSLPVGADPGGSTLPPIPKVDKAKVKPLVGRWTSAAGDFFLFKADGSGVWKKSGRELWKGKVVPEGGGKFRFSWQGGVPQEAGYWGVTLEKGGKKLVFAGTNQTYTKGKGQGQG